MHFLIAIAIVVPLVLVAGKTLVGASVRKTSDRNESGHTEYRVSPYLFGIFAASILMGATFSLWGMESGITTQRGFIFSLCGSICVVGSILAIWWYSKCRVLVTDSDVRIITLCGEKMIVLKGLIDVRVSNGMIILDEGKIPRTSIPIIYKNSGDLLISIENHRGAAPPDRGLPSSAGQP